MAFILDLHIHSKYSRGTSPQMNLENIYRFGKIKGIEVIGTGDFTHPEWFREIKEQLEPAGVGLFKLKDKLARPIDEALPKSVQKNQLRFLLTAEISNIYSKNGKVRKLHNILVAPDFKAVAKINKELGKIGNLTADGRPILGLDSKKLLEISLATDKNNFFIPAHIWTPWFSMFGSKSGFDSIEEAFEELTPEIRAVETGLSSDPFMNWRVKELRNMTIISNSDAHSPMKLGREATVMDCELNYNQIIEALKTNDKRVVGTIEFFPQEGKYHYDGHRKCKVCLTPEETKKYNGLCPRCGKPLVVGVDYRVEELADKPGDFKPKTHKKVEYIIPLAEILAELKGVKTIGASILRAYEKVYTTLGDEFKVLRTVPIAEIKAAGFDDLAEAISRLRARKIHIEPGYDGVYGVIKVFGSKEEVKKVAGQTVLF